MCGQVVVMAYLWLDAAQSLQQIALLTNTAVRSPSGPVGICRGATVARLR